MEEEIIGNRWKELDYDGYCLPSFPFPSLRFSARRFLTPYVVRPTHVNRTEGKGTRGGENDGRNRHEKGTRR